MIVFRHVRSGFPFLWEASTQPEGRWHAEGEGPAHYLADTPDGAWAEFLRRQDIRDSMDLLGISRDLWAIEISNEQRFEKVALPNTTSTERDYRKCQAEATRLRSAGATGLQAPSAALRPNEANGYVVKGGMLKAAAPRNGTVYVLFGPRHDLVGWKATSEGRPSAEILRKVRYL